MKITIEGMAPDPVVIDGVVQFALAFGMSVPQPDGRTGIGHNSIVSVARDKELSRALIIQNFAAAEQVRDLTARPPLVEVPSLRIAPRNGREP